MSPLLVSFLFAIVLSIITVIADMLIKKSSLNDSFDIYFILGTIIYGLTAFGWFYILKNLKLSTSGVIYGASCIILLTLVSVFYFKEKINFLETIGIIMAIASIIILYKFG